MCINMIPCLTAEVNRKTHLNRQLFSFCCRFVRQVWLIFASDYIIIDTTATKNGDHADMKRADSIFSELQSTIPAGEYGPSGSTFITVRELARKYSCSLHCALDVFDRLLDGCLILSIGKRSYVTTGPCGSRTPLGKFLSESQRDMLGILLQDSSNPFFGSLIRHLYSVAAGNRYQLIVSCTGGSPEREREILDLFLKLGCRGVFSCVPVSKQQEPLFRNYPLPLVTLAEESHLPNTDVILVNNYTAGRQIAKHLMKCGCRSFAYVTEADYIESDRRLKGFRDYLHENGSELNDENIFVVTQPDSGIISREIGWFTTNLLNRTRQLGIPLPLGIFCVHDLLAVETSRAVKRYRPAKYKPFCIPDDVMIAGFDDLPIAAAVTPTLTTVSYRYSAMAETAFGVMTDYITNPDHVPKQYEISSSLIIRESTSQSSVFSNITGING